MFFSSFSIKLHNISTWKMTHSIFPFIVHHFHNKSCNFPSNTFSLSWFFANSRISFIAFNRWTARTQIEFEWKIFLLFRGKTEFFGKNEKQSSVDLIVVMEFNVFLLRFLVTRWVFSLRCFVSLLMIAIFLLITWKILQQMATRMLHFEENSR